MCNSSFAQICYDRLDGKRKPDFHLTREVCEHINLTDVLKERSHSHVILQTSLICFANNWSCKQRLEVSLNVCVIVFVRAP